MATDTMSGYFSTAARECICPTGERSLGRLYGVSMGRGIVRLSMTKDCPEHDSCHDWTKAKRKEYAAFRPWTTPAGPWCPIHATKDCPSASPEATPPTTEEQP